VTGDAQATCEQLQRKQLVDDTQLLLLMLDAGDGTEVEQPVDVS